MAHCTLGGRDRDLRLEWKALRRLRNEYDINLLSADLDESLFTDPQSLTAIVWACCLHEDPKLTLEKVDTWLSIPLLATVAAAVGAAIQESLTVTD